MTCNIKFTLFCFFFWAISHLNFAQTEEINYLDSIAKKLCKPFCYNEEIQITGIEEFDYNIIDFDLDLYLFKNKMKNEYYLIFLDSSQILYGSVLEISKEDNPRKLIEFNTLSTKIYNKPLYDKFLQKLKEIYNAEILLENYVHSFELEKIYKFNNVIDFINFNYGYKPMYDFYLNIKSLNISFFKEKLKCYYDPISQAQAYFSLIYLIEQSKIEVDAETIKLMNHLKTKDSFFRYLEGCVGRPFTIQVIEHLRKEGVMIALESGYTKFLKNQK
jgi:hypothetical protein